MGSLAQEFPRFCCRSCTVTEGMAPAAQHPSPSWDIRLSWQEVPSEGWGGMFLSTPIRPGFQFSPQLLTTCL